MIEIQEYIGNIDLLKLNKTAFLCSQKCPAETILKSYDWAKSQRQLGNCIVCGNHSQIEKDVFGILLKGEQPIIHALARGLKERIEPEFQQAIKQGRLLIITPFSKEVKRVTEQTATIRNKMMIELSNIICIGHVNPGGNLEAQLEDTEKQIFKFSGLNS
jgi:hypothetical protein